MSSQAEYLSNIFYDQDFEHHNFDAVFHVEGQELYAHRDVLAYASSVFKELFINNRPSADNPVNQPIQIDKYTYDEFKEFIRCIYHVDDLRHFDLHDNKLYPLIELADIYEVEEIEAAAGKALAYSGGFSAYRYGRIGFAAYRNRGELDDNDIEDIFEKIEFADKYSLEKFGCRHWIKEFLKQHFTTLIGYDGFINLEKSTVRAFVAFVYENSSNNVKRKEELLKSVYKWAKQQAMVTDDTPKEESKEAILHQLSDILPLFEFNEYDGFGDLEKSVIEVFVYIVLTDNRDVNQKEKLCKAVYKWGEHQAMVNDQMPEEERKEVVLHYIKDILPYFEFKDMSYKFLCEFLVEKGLLSLDEAREYATTEVRVTCNNKRITGSFVDDYGIFVVIKSKEKEKLIDRGDKKRCFWDKTFKHPSKPCELKKMKGVQWYLVFDINGKLNLKHHSLIKKTDYLIAEMKVEDGAVFTLDKNHVAFATVSR